MAAIIKCRKCGKAEKAPDPEGLLPSETYVIDCWQQCRQKSKQKRYVNHKRQGRSSKWTWMPPKIPRS